MGLQKLPQPEFLHHDEEPQSQPPQDEIRRHPMPDARHQPHRQQIEHGPGRAFPASAQWDVQVIFEPPPQRHMPSAIVFADAPGAVRVVKVPRQLESQHAAQSYGHEAVSLEIEQELHGVRGGTHPGKGRGNALKAHGLYVMPEDAHRIRDDDLERQARNHQGQAMFDALCADFPPAHLLDGLMIFRDGPRQQLGEHGGIGPVLQKTSGRLPGPPVHIYVYGQHGKGIKADAGRQGRCHIFKIPQEPRMQQDGPREPPPAPGKGAPFRFHGAQQQIVHRDGNQQDHRSGRAAQGAEKDAGPKECQVPVPYRTQVINQQKYGKKAEYEVQI